MVKSIGTVIEAGHSNRKNLSLPPGEGAGAMHQLEIQGGMMPHHGGVDGMDLNDVVGIGNPFGRSEFSRWDVSDESHEVSP